MKRQHLMRDIEQLDHLLTAQRITLHKQSQASLQALRRVPPLYLVAAGFLTGAAIGRLGWRKAYSVGRMGTHLYPLMNWVSLL